MSDKDKAAPVGEREAFEAHMRIGGYSNPDKHPDGSYVSSVMELWWQGWKARSAYQRAQQPQSAEAVAFQKPSMLKDYNIRYSISTAPQPSAGVVMPEVLEDLELVRVALRGFLPCIARTEGLRAVSRVIARLNGKEVGRG